MANVLIFKLTKKEEFFDRILISVVTLMTVKRISVTKFCYFLLKRIELEESRNLRPDKKENLIAKG